MTKKKVTKSGINYEISSGNVFADLGLSDAGERHVRAMLGVRIFKILDERKIKKQKDIAELLDIDKSEASKLMNAEFSRFSQERLIRFLNKLDYRVIMQIMPMKKGDMPQEVVMA